MRQKKIRTELLYVHMRPNGTSGCQGYYTALLHGVFIYVSIHSFGFLQFIEGAGFVFIFILCQPTLNVACFQAECGCMYYVRCYNRMKCVINYLVIYIIIAISFTNSFEISLKFFNPVVWFFPQF